MLDEKKLIYRAISQKHRSGQHKAVPGAAAARPAAIILVCVLLITFGITTAFAAPSEYEIKAAFLFNFASYVEWPPRVSADSGGTFIIGVYGDNSFADLLRRTVAGKTVGGRKVEVRKFSAIRDLKPCHILFISSSEESSTSRILSAVRDWHVLTVGESDGFARTGGIIGFYLENKKVRFEINPNAARRSGLKISSRLLKLAKIATT